VLSTLQAMPRPGSRLAYQGVVESGAPLAVWREQEDSQADATACGTMQSVELSLKPMPSAAELEAQWRSCTDPVQKERLWRKRGVRKVVGDGASAQVPFWTWRLGDCLVIAHPNEAYSQFQIALRSHFHPRPVVVITLANGSAGY